MEWNGIICRIRKLNGLKQYKIEWNEWDDLLKHKGYIWHLAFKFYSKALNDIPSAKILFYYLLRDVLMDERKVSIYGEMLT